MTHSEHGEQERLAELRGYHILDTPPEPLFERVAQLAARTCAAPMAVVTLVDEERQWFKARVGIAAHETERALAFCAHAIEQRGHFVVVDSLDDPRFADNPLVVGEPKIRSYHGVPLVNPRGHALGTLAVLDHQPRKLDALQCDTLDVLAEQVMVQLEERRLRREQQELVADRDRLNRDLAEAGERYRELFVANPVPMWVFAVDTLAFLDVNDAAIHHYGYTRDEFLAMTIADIRPAADVGRLRQVTSAPRPELTHSGLWRHVRADGSIVSVDIASHAVAHDGREARLVVARDMSDVEATERAAAWLAGQLSTTYDTITDGVLVLDHGWRVVFVNPAGAELLRTPFDDLVGTVVWDRFPEAVGTSFERQFRQSVERQQPTEFDMWWEQTGRWGEVRLFPSTDGLTVYFRDITDEKHAEQSNQRLIDRLSRILEMWRALSDRPATVDEVLDAVPRLVQEVLDVDAVVFYIAEDDSLRPLAQIGFDAPISVVPRTGSLAGEGLASGSTVGSDDLHADPRSAQVAHQTSARSAMSTPVELNRGAVGAITVTDARVGYFDEADARSLDLLGQALGAAVRRVATEEEVRHSEERFRLVSIATTDAIYDADLALPTIWWGEGFRDLFGWEAGDRPNGVWPDLIHPDDRGPVVAEMQAAIDDPDVDAWESEYRMRRSDGVYATVRNRMHVVRRSDGTAVRLVGGISDVTAHVEAELRTRQSQRLEAVGQLTGGVAHDFNNLLTVILGSADELGVDLADDPELGPFIEMISSAAQRGADLAHHLLAFARQQPLEPQPTEVNRLLGQIDQLLRRTLPEHVELELVRSAGVWTALVDPSQLEAAILNLCLNARDAMPDGGRLTIETGNVRIDQDYADAHDEVSPGQYVMVAVSDTGTGIAADQIDRVFEPFFTTKHTGAGTGLGLSMVHGFAKQSAGHVKVYSELGEGTTVRLYLPRTSEPALEPSARSVVAPTGGTERVLVVEDDDGVRQLATQHLRSLGYDVVEASQGLEALQVLATQGPVDLMFTDVVMPGGISGRELARRATEAQPDLRVLYTSGYTENAIVHQGRLDPGVQLLSKPYRLAELGRRVRAALDGPATR